MTSILTVRVSPELKAKAEARAAELGLDRGGYVRTLIEQDLGTRATSSRTLRFRSEDFIGSVPLARGPYTNQRVQQIVRRRLTRRHEEDR